jgi:hypothetical protein
VKPRGSFAIVRLLRQRSVIQQAVSFKRRMFKKNRRQDAARRADRVLRCSFCNKTQDDVRKLVAGPSVFICDECVEVCNDIIADDAGLSASAEVKDGAEPNQLSDIPVTGPAVRCALCRMPTPIDDGLLIPNRGVLCPGCIDEVEATAAERRQQDS